MSANQFENLGFTQVCEGVYSSRNPDCTLLDIPAAVGAEPLVHDSLGTIVWDITPSSDSSARSHSADEFAMHTDAAFDIVPPHFVAMEVVHEDQYGGGVQSYMPLSALDACLATATKDSLAQPYTWDVPEEFRVTETQTRLPVLFTCEGLAGIRFREDCIVSTQLTTEQSCALHGLCRALYQVPKTQHSVQSGELLIVDNWRTLHARTAVRDEKRHLKRIRF